MTYGKFTGCGCCAAVNVCEPRRAADGVGDVSLYSWGFSHVDDTNRQAAGAKWTAYLVVATTHAGLYRFEFEKAFTRTFHIPTVAGRSSDFWGNVDKTYFAEVVTVDFDLVAVRVGIGPADPLLVLGSPEDDAYRIAFGGLSPWDVGLTTFPIASMVTPPVPGVVQYPSDFSIWQGIPPVVAPATVIEDHIEASWATGVESWLGGVWNSGDGFSWQWGWGNQDTILYVLNDPQFFHYYTNYPRGITFMPSGLGVLNELIHQFGWADFITTRLSWDGYCYPNRLNAFIAPISFALDGTVWDHGSTPPYTPEFEAAIRIMAALNDAFTLEWGNTDKVEWTGRNDHWGVLVDVRMETDGRLVSYPTASGSSTDTITIDVQVGSLFGHWGDSYVGISGPVVFQGNATMTYNAMKALPGVGSYESGASTYLFLEDPALFIAALSPTLVWTYPVYALAPLDWTGASVVIS